MRRSSGRRRFARTTGRAGRRAVLQEVVASDRDLDAVDRRVLPRGGDGRPLVVDAGDRPEAELRRGDRQDAGAAADVHDRTLRVELAEQLEAEPRRVVRARAEGLARVDDHVDRAGRRRRVPGRAHVELPHVDGLVEVPPALAPVVVDLRRDDLDQRVADGRLEVRAARAARPARRRPRTRRGRRGRPPRRPAARGRGARRARAPRPRAGRGAPGGSLAEEPAELADDRLVRTEVLLRHACRRARAGACAGAS